MSLRVLRSLDQLPSDLGPTVVTIGNFDGVHCGHRSILELITRRARQLSTADAVKKAVAVTFEPHPLRVLRPEDSPRLITPLNTRLELLTATGVDAVLMLPFTAELSEMAGEQFATAVLHDALGAVEVHEGENFRFGRRAHCGVKELRAFGAKLGFAVEVHPPLHIRGMMVSSSKVRQCILQGEMGRARALLGRPFSIRSTAAAGRGIGSRLTVPTINLRPYDELLPGDGVYITRLRVGAGAAARVFEAVTNAGQRPTFGADSYAVESYLLDYDPVARPLDLGAETPLELTFLRRLREERRFPSAEALRAQILQDVGRAKRYFQLAKLV